MILDGLWTTRLVKIDLNSIVKVERTKYSSYIINNPVYNLHTKGKIRFYAGGKEAISLTDRDGLEYIIGTQMSRRAGTSDQKGNGRLSAVTFLVLSVVSVHRGIPLRSYRNMP